MPSLIDLDLIMAKRRVVVELRAGRKDAARVQAPSSAGVCHMTLIVGASGNVWTCWPGICADVHTHTPVLDVSVLTKIIMYAMGLLPL
jgi:hypothetical protein